MIIMINGAFGVGKTTVATKLVEEVENAMLFDPEIIGGMLRYLIPEPIRLHEEKTDDFQDFHMWRKMTVQTAELLKITYGKDLIIPMTIWNEEYFTYIIDGLSSIDDEVYHFCLIASTDTIHSRLLSRGETEGSWPFQQTDKCLQAYQTEVFGEYISTEDRSIHEIVSLIRKRIREGIGKVN